MWGWTFCRPNEQPMPSVALSESDMLPLQASPL
jgi:hypothetical protein